MLNRSLIRRGIVVFWAIWFAIVFAGNAADGLKAAGMLPHGWAFASDNYQFMLTVTARYRLPEFLTALMFLAVVVWEGLATALFVRAAFVIQPTTSRTNPAIHSAFAMGLSLWSAFAIADEVFISYAVEATHLRLFIAQLVSLLYLELTPDN